ncbi:MAG: hypothetical protein ABSG61_04140 [Gemmatimonadales bacterium]|jgi:hypothetical protein
MAGTTGSCPACGSPSIQSVSVKRSAVPKDLAAEYFAAAGVPVSDMIAQSVCGRCGCRWFARTSQERQLRALSGQLGQDAMQAAQAQAAAAARPAAAWKQIPLRTWVLAVITAVMILLAIFMR